MKFVSSRNVVLNPATDVAFQKVDAPNNWFRVNTKVFNSLSDNKNMRFVVQKYLYNVSLCNTFRAPGGNALN